MAEGNEIVFFDPVSVLGGRRATKVAELRPQQAELDAVVIVLEKERWGQKAHSAAWSILVGDDSGCVTLACYGALGDAVHEGDILHVRSGSTALQRQELVLHAGALTRVGELELVFSESMNWRDWLWIQDAETLQWRAERRPADAEGAEPALTERPG
eukprot:TRINITY_DN86_c0_g1_i1.p1 TRINITY_DN86_c0_g1~~TRINITY_DN86_c0_g1_i1.p1  ORF type:complete len:157 (-),score=34.69 TRINITY_DN86_c0_g1_i1:4-474(-)